LWGIVNNAGRSLPMGPSEWMRVEDFHSTLNVNMNGVIAMTMTFLPLIKKAQGRIVNVASVLGRVAANGGGYGISKFAPSDPRLRECMEKLRQAVKDSVGEVADYIPQLAKFSPKLWGVSLCTVDGQR
ncbi:hypothetical protein GOODEAATRI_018368, partial [Goodea atripinnis]